MRCCDNRFACADGLSERLRVGGSSRTRRRSGCSCRTYEARELLRSSLRRERSASVVPTKRAKCFGRPYEGGEVRSSSLRRGRSAFVVPTKRAKCVRRPSQVLCEVPKLRANLAIFPTLEFLLLSKEAPRRTPLVSDRRLIDGFWCHPKALRGGPMVDYFRAACFSCHSQVLREGLTLSD
jgi:hypothetical protein